MHSLFERKVERRSPEVLLTGRILFLTEDPKLITQQLAGKELEWDQQRPERNPKLRDELSPDEILPAEVSFFDETLGEFAYTGLKCGGEFPLKRGDIKRGGFVVTVSGKRRGKGSYREQIPYAERSAGIQLVMAENLDRTYEQNCRALGVLTSTSFELIRMIRRGLAIPLREFTECEDENTRQAIEYGGLFPVDMRAKAPELLKVAVHGRKRANVAIQDFILKILSLDYVRSGKAWSKVVEFTGKAIEALSAGERATMTKVAAEIGGYSGILAPNRGTVMLPEMRRGMSRRFADAMIAGFAGDSRAEYAHILELDAAEIEPMVAPAGDPGNGQFIRNLTARVPVEVSHSGACTAEDMDIYARVLADALARGRRIPLTCRFYIPLGSREIRDYCAGKGYLKIFYQAGVTVMEPDCESGWSAVPEESVWPDPGVSYATSRNFPRCGGSGQMCLASPFTVAASAVAGCLVEYEPAEASHAAKAA